MFDFVITVFATAEVIEIWHHSHLFANLRAQVEVHDGFWSQLIKCPFCMAPWVALMLSVWEWAKNSNNFPVSLLVFALAAARAANLLNDLTHSFCRTPKSNAIEEAEEETLP